MARPAMADPLIPNFETSYDYYANANGHSQDEDSNGDAGDPSISWPLERPHESADWSPDVDASLRKDSAFLANTAQVTFNELLPGHKRSQSLIALQAFFLGITLGVSIPAALSAALPLEASDPSRAWRIFFLLGTLSVFHFLEFWTQARFNIQKADAAAFLLYKNGWQYPAANVCALLETVVTSFFYPRWQSHFAYAPLQTVGLVVMVVGQLSRSVAMAHAGSNFNHQVQTRKAKDHKLVTTSIYGWLRHPAYFGFFWWELGLQAVLGNAICFWIYLFVLWEFFSQRIAHEEEHLIKFFGEDYEKYRAKTWIGIPFV